jgi:hypothetical protein
VEEGSTIFSVEFWCGCFFTLVPLRTMIGGMGGSDLFLFSPA